MVTSILHDEEGHRRLFEGFLREYKPRTGLGARASGQLSAGGGEQRGKPVQRRLAARRRGDGQQRRAGRVLDPKVEKRAAARLGLDELVDPPPQAGFAAKAQYDPLLLPGDREQAVPASAAI